MFENKRIANLDLLSLTDQLFFESVIPDGGGHVKTGQCGTLLTYHGASEQDNKKLYVYVYIYPDIQKLLERLDWLH